jgi:hypothetical protein
MGTPVYGWLVGIRKDWSWDLSLVSEVGTVLWK